MLRQHVPRNSRDGANAAPRENSQETTVFTFLKNLSALAKDERGVTALEYGLIADLVAMVIVTSVTALGTTLTNTVNTIALALP